MNLPSGLVFYLDFKYGTAQPGFTTGAGKDSQADSVFGITETSDPSGGLYGAGRFGYSVNETSSATISKATSLSATQYTISSAAAESVYNYDSAFSQSNAAKLVAGGDIAVVTVQTASIDGFDDKGIRGFRLTGVDDQFPQFTKLDGGNITFVAKDTSFGDITVKYHKQPTDISRGDFEATGMGEQP